MTLLLWATVFAACGPPFFLLLTYVAGLASGLPLSAEGLRHAGVAGGVLALLPCCVIIVQWAPPYRQLGALLAIAAGLLWGLAWGSLARAALRGVRRRRMRRAEPTHR